MPPVVVTDLSVVLGSAVILSGIDLTVSGGESMALLGANGSGKSTLVRTILGLHPVDAGGVHLFGHDVRRRSHVPWSRIGYVPQRVGAASGVPATALEVVRSGLLDPRRPFDDRGRRARTRAMAALEAVGLAHRARDHVQIFSGGQAQRVLIARALVRDPELLILDQPTNNLDLATVDLLVAALDAYRGALIVVSHDDDFLARLAIDRIWEVADGAVRERFTGHQMP